MSATPGVAGRSPPPWYLIFFFGALAALGPLSIDVYLPAIPSIAADFGVTVLALQNTLNVFLVGYGIGQFFGGDHLQASTRTTCVHGIAQKPEVFSCHTGQDVGDGHTQAGL